MTPSETAESSQCTRLHVGAVLTLQNARGETVAHVTGYNAPVLKGACNGLQGACGCEHAEQRAFRDLPHVEARGGVLYVHTTHAPCLDCARIALTASQARGVRLVVRYDSEYRSDAGLRMLREARVLCEESHFFRSLERLSDACV